MDSVCTPDSGAPARYWERLDDGRVQCNLCPHHCKLKEGQRGLCFVRMAGPDGLILTTYGRSSGFCIDPIEKKPLNHFLPGTAILSFGTAGCNLRCSFCQNWSISCSRQMDILGEEAGPEAIAAAAAAHGCRSVAFTYNDPVIFLEYAVDIAAACHEKDIKTVAVTAGYINAAPRREFFGAMDAANIDLKAFDQTFYRKLCGGDLQPVLDTLVYLKHETNVWLELTTLLIEGRNDSDEALDRMTRWVVRELGPEVPMHFTAFHPSHKMRDGRPTALSTLKRARKRAQANGVRYVYTGNVSDADGQSTYCHACGKRLISRDGFSLGAWHLRDGGKCAFCGERCAGVFEAEPGQWGARRQPVRIARYT